MTALAWLPVAAILIAVIATELSIRRTSLRRQRAREVAISDADWDREIDQAIALTETPLYQGLCVDYPGAIDSLAAAEASRADWDAPSRWAR
jgi:hypothetical protein